MKAFLLATAMLAAPLIAQDTPPPTPPTEPTTDRATTPTESAPTEPGQPASGVQPAMNANGTAADQVPASQTPPPPMPAAGNVVFRQPPTVDQAFPPPAAKTDYPWCTRTVTDGCKQRRDPK